MARFSFFNRLLDCRACLKGYQTIRTELEHLSEADLADMGAKRYQLGHAARVKAFK